ncbi:response regulator [Roseomonas genomospecies 6]|uniref:response regulator n=1 Tax=Roseomonas genomospecies 6 TaxID=214106 RepID=UPI00142F2517|nr:response regulator [Roseomonas genomospecies 6]
MTAANANAYDGKTLVVIEDNAQLRFALTIFLKEHGYTVAAAASYEEAMGLLDAHGGPPDAILTDYDLGDGRTGLDTIRDVHARYGHSISAIVLTSESLPKSIVEIQRLCHRLLHKPVSPATLLDALAAV